MHSSGKIFSLKIIINGKFKALTKLKNNAISINKISCAVI